MVSREPHSIILQRWIHLFSNEELHLLPVVLCSFQLLNIKYYAIVIFKLYNNPKKWIKSENISNFLYNSEYMLLN